jgi:hypothetical protein
MMCCPDRYLPLRIEPGRLRPAEYVALANWLPVLSGLTPGGLRHGH